MRVDEGSGLGSCAQIEVRPRSAWASLGLPLRVAVPLLVVAFSSTSGQGNSPTVPVVPTAAQRVASTRAGRDVTNAEIADALRRSGLSREEVRSRLVDAGYSPALADPFFAERAEGERNQSALAEEISLAGVSSQTADPTVLAFQALGLIGSPQPGESDAVARPARAPLRSSISAPADPSLSLFGKDIFARAATAFAPVATGAVDVSYRLGAGDQLQFILTGDTEKAYQLTVRPDGSVLLPEIGQVSVAGLTLESARALLRERASSAYSGIRTGSARLDLSVVRVRTNALFVIGEVEQPGAVQVNALSTAFHAIAKAGGPSDKGSFRNIEIRRGGKVVRRLDLYRYVIHGDASSDLRTEHGDVIYVPLAQNRVRVTGAVRRPGTFEILPDERFGDLVKLVGGFLPTASLDRVQIDRVLPLEQRAPGVERALIDVHIRGSLDSLSKAPLSDGDVVTVYSIGEIRRNAITVKGEVVQPGTYELEPGLTLTGVLQRAQGLLPWALTDRIKVSRLNPASSARVELSVDLRDPAGKEFQVREFDQIAVLDGRVPVGKVSVGGAVLNPQTREHAEGLTLKDLIDVSRLKPEAAAVVVARKRIGHSYSDTTSQIARIEIDLAGAWESHASQFLIQPDDNVFVLASPGVREQRFVSVGGLFAFPGTYAINEGVDRLADVVRRAGMTLPSAYPGNFQLMRDTLPLAVDLQRALRGDPVHNVLLLDGDSLRIGPNPSTVMVTGEVGRTVLVLHRPGMSIRDYVDRAGGPSAKADMKRATVEDLSGTVSGIRRFLFFRTSPTITPGSKITVPARPESQGNVREIVNATLQYASMLASLAVAYVAVTR